MKTIRNFLVTLVRWLALAFLVALTGACDITDPPRGTTLDLWWEDVTPAPQGAGAMFTALDFHAEATPPRMIWWRLETEINGQTWPARTGQVFAGEEATVSAWTFTFDQTRFRFIAGSANTRPDTLVWTSGQG